MTLKKFRTIYLLSLMCWLVCIITFLVFSHNDCKLGRDISFIGMWIFVVTNFIIVRIYKNNKLKRH